MAWRRKLGCVALAALLALSAVAARGGLAQTTRPAVDATETPATADGRIVIAYGGGVWGIDPAKGAIQAVVTGRSAGLDGVTVEGIVFIHDGGGWRAAGLFRDEHPGAALRDAPVETELTLAVMGE